MDKVKGEYFESLRGGRFDAVIVFVEQRGGESLLAYTVYMIPFYVFGTIVYNPLFF